MRRLLVAILALSLCGASAAAATENSYLETFDTTTKADLPGTSAWWDTGAGEVKLYPYEFVFAGTMPASYCTDVVVKGNLAYLAAGNGGLIIADISNPNSPSVVSTYAATTVFEVDVAGDVAGIARNGGGFELLDVTNPALPVQLWAISGENVGSVSIVGTRAYIGVNDSLRILDISVPSAPVWVSSVELGGWANRTTVVGDYAYCTRGSTFEIVDISDPTNPTVVYIDNTNSSYVDVQVDGDVAYVSIVDTGVRVYDITNPAATTIITTHIPGNYVYGLALSGDWLYVAHRADGVFVLDVTDPANPIQMDSYDTAGSVEGVAVAGEHLYLADGATMEVLENADFGPAGRVVFDTGVAASKVYVQGNYAYLVEPGDGVKIVSVADPENPVAVENILAFDAKDIFVQGDVAYIANGGFGLRITDVSDPANTTTLSNILTGAFTNVTSVRVVGDYAYVTYEDFGTGYFRIVDVSDPTAPVLKSSYSSLSMTVGDVEGSIAVVTTAFGTRLLDVSDPDGTISVISSMGGGSPAADIVMEGNVLYSVSGTTLWAFDITDPTTPALLGSGTLSQGGAGLDLWVEGDVAYVAAGSTSLYGFSVSNPASPTLQWWATLDTGSGVHLAGDLIYVATDAGMSVWRAFNRSFLSTSANAKSLNINPQADSALAVRVVPTQNVPPESISWSVSWNGGANFQSATPNEYVTLTAPGMDVRWRGTLGSWYLPRSNPTVTEVRFDFLYDVPVITNLTDVGNDQGGQARVYWTRSAHDDPADADPIMEYAIYRRIEAGLAPALAATPIADGAGSLGRGWVDPQAAQLAGWDYVLTVPAEAEDEYSTIVPTLVDSSTSGIAYSTFLVRARTATPGGHHDSPADSGYSVDNLAPGVPANVVANYGTGSGNQLDWNPSEDEDFQYFRIYRDPDPNFVPGVGNLVDAITANTWTDSEYDGGGVFYKLTAMDFAGNESDVAAPVGPTVGVDRPLIAQLDLLPAAPNPFRSSTVLRYAIPSGVRRATVSVYDISGRRVRVLFDGEVEPGVHSLRWNGDDDSRRSVAPGLYLTRLVAGAEVRVERLVRVR